LFLSDALIAKLKKNFEKSACQNESGAYNSRPATESFERGFGGGKISQQLVDEVFRAVLTMLTFSKRVSKKACRDESVAYNTRPAQPRRLKAKSSLKARD
jgi:hypothetical protein